MSLLTLADAPAIAGTDDIILALVEVSVSGNDITGGGHLPAAPGGLFLAGDLIVSDELRISQVERHGSDAGSLIRLRRQGGLLRNYFGTATSALYPDAKLYIQTDIMNNWGFTVGATGNGFNNWSADEDVAVTEINDLVNGDCFIIRITTPAVIDDTIEDTDLPEISVSSGSSSVVVALDLAAIENTNLPEMSVSSGAPSASIILDIPLFEDTNLPEIPVSSGAPSTSIILDLAPIENTLLPEIPVSSGAPSTSIILDLAPIENTLLPEIPVSSGSSSLSVVLEHVSPFAPLPIIDPAIIYPLMNPCIFAMLHVPKE